MAGMMLLQSFLLLLKLVSVGYESAINSATKIYTDRCAKLGYDANSEIFFDDLLMANLFNNC